MPSAELDRLRPHLEPVPLKAKRVLHHFGAPMQHVWFVETGLIAVTARVSAEMAVEVWLVGDEGMTGLPVILGGADAPPHRRIVLVEGRALCIRTEDLNRALQQQERLRELMLLYAQLVLLQTSQAGACNGFHPLPQRLARWLLSAQDRLRSDTVAVTHDVLARMLGVRRASVTETVACLAASGALEQGRGQIRICRDTLEPKACECRQIMRAGYDRFLRACCP